MVQFFSCQGIFPSCRKLCFFLLLWSVSERFGVCGGFCWKLSLSLLGWKVNGGRRPNKFSGQQNALAKVLGKLRIGRGPVQPRLCPAFLFLLAWNNFETQCNGKQQITREDDTAFERVFDVSLPAHTTEYTHFMIHEYLVWHDACTLRAVHICLHKTKYAKQQTLLLTLLRSRNPGSCKSSTSRRVTSWRTTSFRRNDIALFAHNIWWNLILFCLNVVFIAVTIQEGASQVQDRPISILDCSGNQRVATLASSKLLEWVDSTFPRLKLSVVWLRSLSILYHSSLSLFACFKVF